MNEARTNVTSRRPVALALACVLATGLGFAVAMPSAGAVTAREHVTGSARVIDGDTIEIAGTRIRLEGIDAPEMGQTCARRFLGTWGCGNAAMKALQRMLAGRTVICDSVGTDKYGRMLGICSADGRDINRQMVLDGNAWAFVKYSARYVVEESEARAARRGIFATDNQPAWDYRARQWQTAGQQAPQGCAIKGNVTRNGRIYHMPWSPWYGKVVIEEARGERWFCSEAEALAAGWRAAHGT